MHMKQLILQLYYKAISYGIQSSHQWFNLPMPTRRCIKNQVEMLVSWSSIQYNLLEVNFVEPSAT